TKRPSRTESARTRPARTASARTASARTASARTASARTASARTASTRTAPARTASASKVSTNEKTRRAPARPKQVGKKAARKPALLSGDNPQIAKGEGEAPVRAYIEAIPDWKQDVGRRLDALITRTVPKVRKAVKWNSPFYGIEGQGWFLSFHCFKKYVKVAFFRGPSLRPVPAGASKHDEVRYVDIYETDQPSDALLTRWIRQASKLPGWIP